MKVQKQIDAFATLGVHRESSDEQIREAYLKLAREHHPDRGGDGNKFAEAATAYALIRTKEKRARYLHVVEITVEKCVACEGTGVKRKQKGFTHVIVTPCAKCGGSGYLFS
jgi:DnaJ-class molecular chaperone